MQNIEGEGNAVQQVNRDDSSAQARSALLSDIFCQPTQEKQVPKPEIPSDKHQVAPPPRDTGVNGKPQPNNREILPPLKPEPSKPTELKLPGSQSKPEGLNKPERIDIPSPRPEPNNPSIKGPTDGPGPVQGGGPRVIICGEISTTGSKQNFPAISLVDDSRSKI